MSKSQGKAGPQLRQGELSVRSIAHSFAKEYEKTPVKLKVRSIQ
jgi:hypothetical protein